MSGNGPARVTVERLGARGEGVAALDGGRVYVPYALPGERVSIDREGERGTLIGVLEASRDRVAPFCPHFGTCGGCAVQHWAADPYARWKRGLLVAALERVGVRAEVAPLVDAHGAGRRRATFHARADAHGGVRTGFMQARSHAIVTIEACPVLDPRLAGALPAARAIAAALAGDRIGRARGAEPKPLDILCTATSDGLDVDLRGHGPLDDAGRARLVAIADAHGLARLSNHGAIVLQRLAPTLDVGAARVALPPGAFLQATVAGEAALAARVKAALAGAKRVADLFSGIGTFALRLAAGAAVTAVDADAPALAALDRAARAAPRPVATLRRDLHRRPMTSEELAPFDAVCLDPPRAGAEAQARALAASEVRKVVSVSCDAASFARDAAILVAGGYALGQVVPVDQFRHTAHLEVVAAFERPRPRRARRLLG